MFEWWNSLGITMPVSYTHLDVYKRQGEKRIGNDYPYWEVKCRRGITLPQIVSSGNVVPVFSKVILVLSLIHI